MQERQHLGRAVPLWRSPSRSRGRLKSPSTANDSSQNVLVLWVHGVQPFKVRNEFRAGHCLRCRYRQSHYVGLFQFPKDYLNGPFVLSFSKPADRLSPNLVVGVCEACRESVANGRRIQFQQRTYCKRCPVASIDVLIPRQTDFGVD